MGGTWSLGNRSCYNPFEKLARGALPGAENLHLDTKTLWLKKLTISDHAIYDVAAWTKTERLAGNVLVAATPVNDSKNFFRIGKIRLAVELGVRIPYMLLELVAS